MTMVKLANANSGVLTATGGKTRSFQVCLGRHDSTLRRARFRGKQGSIFEVTGLQPFMEHGLVRWDMP